MRNKDPNPSCFFRVYQIITSTWARSKVICVNRKKVIHYPYFNASHCWFIMIVADTCPYDIILKMWKALEDYLDEPVELSVV